MVNPNRATSPPSTVQLSSQTSAASLSNPKPSIQTNALSFADNFWGEKINGFDVLCANLKHSLTSVKELEQFLRDCASSEDSYAKMLNKLVAASNKFSPNGTFAPVWSCLRELNERFAAAHLNLVHQLQELIKDIQRYIDELSKKIKKIRENEVQTQNVVSQFQEIQLQLQKSKEAYHNLCIEFDKARRQLDPSQLASYQQVSQQQVSTSNLMNLVNNGANSGGSSGQAAISGGLGTSGASVGGGNGVSSNMMVTSTVGLDTSVPQTSGATDRLTSLATSITANRVTQLLKIEKKVKLALEDYKSSIDKYNQIRVEYERKLADSCNHFQYAEENHLKQMRGFIDAYSKLVASIQQNKQQIYTEFSSRLTEQYTVEYLMQTFVENKRTGQERPDIAQFVETACNPFNNPVQQPALLDGNDYSLFVNNPASLNRVNNSPLSFNQSKTDQLDSNSALRSTPPVYFSSSNLMNNSQMYSQLTNSVSTTTLNTINQQQPTAAQSQSASISPFNGAPMDSKPAKNDTKGGGLNIFNVDFLTRKNRERKEKKNAAAAAAAAADTNTKSSKFSRNKKSKQNANTSQYENLGTNNPLNTTLNQTNGSLSVSNHSNKDSSSINSEDSNEHNQTKRSQSGLNLNDPQNSTHISSPTSQLMTSKISTTNLMDTAPRSISSITTGSLSFDLLDQLKPNTVGNGPNGGSDVDSEGYSIRPADAASIDLKTQNFNSSSSRRANKDNDDMNNFYNSSSTSSNSDDSDSDAGSSIGPVKVMLKIKPKSEVVEDPDKQKNNTDVLREISKNLQLKPPGQQLSNFNTIGRNGKTRAYYYNYGTSASTSSTPTPTNEQPPLPPTSSHITRSISAGSVMAPPPTNNQSLLDLDFSKPTTLALSKTAPGDQSITNNLYNIDEDKEVESSFNPTYQARKSSTVSSAQSPATTAASNGRFTPACFPGRTTPDFRHTTSLFEQQGTRASIISPLTINGGSEIIPIAIAFNETIHAYFKMGDPNRFKVKCFGCMKISFPFAILKILAIELPQLEFRLSQLQIANQDLKINNQLLQRRALEPDLTASTGDDLSFEFIAGQLTQELKQQHQQNKQAAFFNFELLKYEFKYMIAPPLVLNAAWTCSQPSEHAFELSLDYVYNFRKNLSQAHFMVILPLTVVWGDQVCKLGLLKSEPTTNMVQENENKLQVLWQVGSINSGSRITAKFHLTAPGHSKPTFATVSASNYEQFYQPVYAKFHIDNETLSQVKLQILSPNYKLSLLREKVETGKYFCNHDQQQPPTPSNRPTTTPPTEAPKSDEATTPTEANNPTTVSAKKTPAAGSLSTHIGSTVDVLLNY